VARVAQALKALKAGPAEIQEEPVPAEQVEQVVRVQQADYVMPEDWSEVTQELFRITAAPRYPSLLPQETAERVPTAEPARSRPLRREEAAQAETALSAAYLMSAD
jgi:hypothetical protein